MAAKSKKTIIKKKYYCVECEKELKRITLGDGVFALFGPLTLYCLNEKCNRFGLITVGMIEK